MLTTLNSPEGAIFYFEKGVYGFTCKNLDVPESAATLTFIDESHSYSGSGYYLKNVMKQFPNIKTIIINEGVRSIEIYNSMFPNVEKVISHSRDFTSGPMLVSSMTGILFNSFYHDKDFVIDMKNITYVRSYAFEGCLAEHIENIPEQITAQGDSFAGSALEFERKYFKNGVFLIGKTVVGSDNAADIAVIPDDAVDVYVKNANNISEIIFSNPDQLGKLEGTSFNTLAINNKLSLSVDDLLSYLSHIRVKAYRITDDSDRFCTVDGVIYTKDRKVLVKYPDNRDGHYDIPEGTECILHNAFAESKIESVKFPESLYRIGTYAFSDCKKLIDIQFNHTINDYSKFGDMGQFYGCVGLKELEIPSWIKVLSNWMFSRCNFKKIVLHEGLEVIGENAFGYVPMDTLSVPRTLKMVKSANFGRFLKELHLHDRAPEGIMFSVLNQYNDASIHNKEILTFKLVVNENGKDYVFYLPKSMPKEVISKLDEFFHMFSPKAADMNWIDSLYTSCFNIAAVQDTAFELYNITKKDIFRDALKRSRQSIVKRYFNEGEEERLIKFLQLGFFAKSSLEKFLQIAHENNMSALAAYILTEIEKKTPKNTSKKFQI